MKYWNRFQWKKQLRLRYRNDQGFSLVELQVVVGIVGLLFALLLPAISQCREASRRVCCANNMRQVAFANLGFESSRRSLPPGSHNSSSVFCWAYLVDILPFFEADVSLERFFREQDDCMSFLRNSIENSDQAMASNAISTLACPSDSVAGARGSFSNWKVMGMYPLIQHSYMGVAGDQAHTCATQVRDNSGSMFSESWMRLKRVTDGLSKTCLIGERGVPIEPLLESPIWGVHLCGVSNCDHYGSTYFGLANGFEKHDEQRFWSWHSRSVGFAFLDGSQHHLSEDIEPRLLHVLSTRNGGEDGSVF